MQRILLSDTINRDYNCIELQTLNALITKDNNGRKDVIVFHRYEEIVSDK